MTRSQQKSESHGDRSYRHRKQIFLHGRLTKAESHRSKLTVLENEQRPKTRRSNAGSSVSSETVKLPSRLENVSARKSKSSRARSMQSNYKTNCSRSG